MGKTPQDDSHNKSRKLGYVVDSLSILLLIISLVQVRFSILNIKILLIISAVILLIQTVAIYYRNYYFDLGNKDRFNMFLDNSFGRKIIPCYNSDEYFDNKDIEAGFIKALANTHQNSFFTSNLAKLNKKSYYIFSFVVLFLFVYAVFINGLDDTTSLLLNFIVSGEIINKAIKYNSLYDKTNNIYESCNRICSSYQTNNQEKFFADIFEIIISYENIIYESKIELSQKIFLKNNSRLTLEWEKIKDDYKIYSKSREIKE